MYFTRVLQTRFEKKKSVSGATAEQKADLKNRTSEVQNELWNEIGNYNRILHQVCLCVKKILTLALIV